MKRMYFIGDFTMSTEQSKERRLPQSDEELKPHGDQLSEAVTKVVGAKGKESGEIQPQADNSDSALSK